MRYSYDGEFPWVSYITASGDEIILASPDISRYWVTFKRKGFDGPPLRTEKRQYADGTTDIMAVYMKERPLTLEMVAVGKTSMERDAIVFDIASRITQLGTQKDWGKLRVRRNDGKFLFIDCVYTGGLENTSRVFPRIQQFELNFLSGNGFFYDVSDTVISTQQLSNLVYLEEDIYLSDDLFLTDGSTEISVNNSGEIFYPIIELYGPASVIRISNETTGKTIAIDPSYSILTGEKLTFNCRDHERSIVMTDTNGTKTDVTNKLSIGASLVWEVVKGQNDITFAYSDATSSTYAKFRYRQRYLSA